MRVLILGGTGLTGPFVARRLHNLGHEVTVFHRGKNRADLPDGVRRIYGDVRQPPASLRELAPDVAVHMWAMNETDTRAFLAGMRGAAGRIVAISSGDVYRNYARLKGQEPGAPDPSPLTESSPLRESRYPYRGMQNAPLERVDEYDKVLVEQALREQPDPPVTILRFPAVYGPNDHHRFKPWLDRMPTGKAELPIEEGFAAWRWTHGFSENVAEAVVLSVIESRAAGQTYNVGEQPTPTWAERLAEWGRIAGWSGRITVVPAASIPEDQRMPPLDYRHHLEIDTSRIRNELGYREMISREEAIARTIAWERQALERHG
ncbi:MAG TPA: NAD-dependent epimerase/dehydratase family protein [Bryobacteraceae bacterium]|nr:NAD-dependent epimerase/dehydratase family protein [Bryobacteraceae bacterium]